MLFINMEHANFHAFQNKTIYSWDIRSRKFKGGEPGFSVFCEKKDEFAVGKSYYKLVESVDVRFSLSNEMWACFISELTGYSGIGNTREESFDDLKVNIHADFQKLLRMRPFEMTEEEKNRWSELCNVIDLLYYNHTTPLVSKEIGCVSYGQRSYPCFIKWITGENYTINAGKVPGDLMSCKTGQWIEAVIKKDPISYRILEIESIQKISFYKPSESEIERYWSGLEKVGSTSSELVW